MINLAGFVGGCVHDDPRDSDQKEIMMLGRLYSVVIDCPDPQALARFYAELTGYDVLYEDGDWATLGKGDSVRVAFQRAPDHQPPRWPDPAHPQQFHLDIFVADLDAGEKRVLALGATPLHREGESFRVFADPAGHPFCLCADDPSAP
jgi:catechol 2,3-dioxygenase-like lactoylglutathione lyase family enzyme